MFLMLIIATIFIPSWFTAKQVIQDTVTQDEIAVLKELGQEISSEEGGTDLLIASSAEEGHYVSYFAIKKNVIDRNFIYVPNLEIRYNDINTLYTTISGSDALDIAHKYDIGYIYLSPRTKKIFGIEGLKYSTDEKCFRKVTSSGEVEVYKVRC